MAGVGLSRKQLHFAILIESHFRACECLFSLVVDAIKATNPENWKDVVCSCFGHGVRRHVKQSLDNEIAVTDFYAVCKILRSRLQDVARLCGGQLLDPYKRERLSLQIQGVETTRHWLFHSQQSVSPRELWSSLAFLITILGSLPHQPERSISVFQRLSTLLAHAKKLCTSKADISEFPICSAAVRSALLQCALIELKNNFTAFLHRRKLTSNQKLKSCENTKLAADLEDYRSLFSEIGKASNNLSKNEQVRAVFGDDQPNLSITDMCKNVYELRNALAHGKHLEPSETKSGISQIRELLLAFHLHSEQATSAQKILQALPNDRNSAILFCYLENEEHDNTNMAEYSTSERILRPRGRHFIGRKEEFVAITSTLGEDNCRPERLRRLLVFGPPGIGKSYLAVEVAHSLIKRYNIQAWVNCSTPCHLQQDLDLSYTFQTLRRYSSVVQSDPIEDSISSMAGECNIVGGNGLVVFDDVCISTVCLVHDHISNSFSSVLITTKSPTVKLLLHTSLSSLRVVGLKPFSLGERKELVAKTTNVSNVNPVTSASIDKVLCGALGNLPLGVNVYSSFLAMILKKPKKIAFDVFDERLVIDHWEDIEERFFDRLHVRGLTGVVQCAKTYLRTFPLAMFVLTKICLVDSERVPWSVIQLRRGYGIPLVKSSSATIRSDPLVSGLLGVTDWLFSDAGWKTLQLCRHELEELGLIYWEESTSTVHIHRLILKSVQEMLEANNHFMSDLVNLFRQRWPIARNSNITAKEVSVRLLTELFAQILQTCNQIVSQAWLCDSCPRKMHESLEQVQQSFPAFQLPENHLAQSTQSKLLEVREMFNSLRGDLSTSLLMYTSLLSLSNHRWPLKLLANIPEASLGARSSQNVHSINNWVSLNLAGKDAEQKSAAALFKEAKESYENCLKHSERFFGEHSYEAAMLHCAVAFCIERASRKVARKDYIRVASKKCPQLTIFQTAKDMLQTKWDGENQNKGKVSRAKEAPVEMWTFLLHFQIDDQLEEQERVDNVTLEAAHELIELHQEEQKLALEHLRHVRNSPAQPHNEFWRAKQLNQWSQSTSCEGALWVRLQQYGHFLRIVVKQLPVIERDLYCYMTECKFFSTQSDCISCLRLMATRWVRASLFVGHFALGEELCRKLVKNFSNTRQSFEHAVPAPEIACRRQHDRNSSTSLKRDYPSLCENVAWMNVAAHLSKTIRLLHEEMDFEEALTSFTKPFEEFFRQESCTAMGETALNYIVCVSSLLGGANGLRVMTDISTWAKDANTCSSWKLPLQNASAEISAHLDCRELSDICSFFVQSRTAFLVKDHLSARYYSLKCWKAIVCFFLHPVKKAKKSSEFKTLVVSLLLELARILQQCYAKVESTSVVEWFCGFRFLSARRGRSFFRAAKLGIEYVEFLKVRHRWSEAVEQCELVHHLLVEQFGDDYLQWLPNAPQVAAILQELTSNGGTHEERKVTGELPTSRS